MYFNIYIYIGALRKEGKGLCVMYTTLIYNMYTYVYVIFFF